MPKSDIRWRRAKDFHKIVFPKNMWEALVLVKHKAEYFSIGRFQPQDYYKGKIMMDTGGLSFGCEPPLEKWSKFAIISVKITNLTKSTAPPK